VAIKFFATKTQNHKNPLKREICRTPNMNIKLANCF
jgi:hypothetical protein